MLETFDEIKKFLPRVKKLKTKRIGDDPWDETPYFQPGLPIDSEAGKAFPLGTTVEGYYKGLRSPQDLRQHYCILMESVSGDKFRVAAPYILRNFIQPVSVGQLIHITYIGKLPDKSGNYFQHFDVRLVTENKLVDAATRITRAIRALRGE